MGDLVIFGGSPGDILWVSWRYLWVSRRYFDGVLEIFNMCFGDIFNGCPGNI